MQPAAYVVAGWPAAVNHFMMAAAATQITRPAAPARFLTVYMTLGEPLLLPLSIDTLVQCAHGAGFIPHEAMTRGQLAIR